MENKDYVSLKEYFDKLMSEAEAKANIRMDAIGAKCDLKVDALKEATVLARETMDERLAKMNEFRDTLKDQNSTFVTKAEFKTFCENTAISINSLNESRSEAKGKASQNSVWVAYVIAGISIALTLARYFVH